jgi:peptide/nickel transport system substrate-binding protein
MANRKIVLALVLLLCTWTASAAGKSLRWAAQGDIVTMDPHAQNIASTSNVHAQIYERLIDLDKQMRLSPVLALSWTQTSATVWVFKLRRDVKFHDGALLTADDVVFSLERAKQPTSNFRVYAGAASSVRKLDDYTVEVTTAAPNLALLSHLSFIFIMNKAWCLQHNVERPQDFKNREETYAVRNANGTGPYVLKTREPDVKTVFTENSNWWGKREGNITEATFLPIKSDATRVAALLSGEIDFVLDPPLQDVGRLKATPNLKVVEGRENRIIFLGMDENRDELLYSSVKGRNPFKDVRVRRALYQAIDIEAIKSRVMRGFADPTGTFVSPWWGDYYSPSMEKRLPLDRAKAKQLLTEAGYPEGFEVTLDCPNARYISDEQICQALAAMFGQIGIVTKLNTMPPANYFGKMAKNDTSFYLLGWGGPPADAINTLRNVFHGPRPGGDGDFNYGRATNAKLDELIDRIDIEADPARRREMAAEAFALHDAEVMHIPLHRQVIPWAMRANLSVVHRPDNRLELAWTTDGP